ncbi:LysE family translocator [Actinomadura macra]|uniref:LysE family translocator n=1 Tax=Actinomadura macra TaxID=46164 RepID=UPI0008335045|nr:LysE family translocator [Actinomadura macra]
MIPEPARLLAFVGAAAVLILVPGPNLVYILTRSVAQGRRAGLMSALGVETGTLVHIAAAVLGLSSLIAASGVAFSVLKYAGAAYLVYLAVRALLHNELLDASGGAEPLPPGRLFRDGLLVNVLNPKVALFFLAFLPQFLPDGSDTASAHAQMAVFGVVFFVLALALDVTYALAGARARDWLGRRPRILRRQRFAVAGIYLLLGAYAVLSE